MEPDETIAELYSLPDVKEAIVLASSVDSTTELVAYVSGNGLEPPDGPKLRAQLADRLPGPLVPSEVIVLPSLPRLAGGKIDRQALPKTVAVIAETPSRAPRNEREERLAGLLSELLGGKPLGIDDNFFALGGDSLTAVSFAARANAAGFNFPAAAVFQYPTVAQLVEQLPPPSKKNQNQSFSHHSFIGCGYPVPRSLNFSPGSRYEIPQTRSNCVGRLRTSLQGMRHFSRRLQSEGVYGAPLGCPHRRAQ